MSTTPAPPLSPRLHFMRVSDISAHTRSLPPYVQSAYLIGEMYAATSRLAPLPRGGRWSSVECAALPNHVVDAVTMALGRARPRLAGRWSPREGAGALLSWGREGAGQGE